jgi:hypothetical protein
MMKRWSNDRFLSTPHGVLNDSGKDSLLHRLLLQPQRGRDHRVRAELHRRMIRRTIRPPSIATSSWPSNNANYYHRQNYAGKTS